MVDVITPEEYAAAKARGRRALAKGPLAVAARYEQGKIVVELNNQCSFAFPAANAQGLAGASPADLRVIEITPSGLGLHWPRLDADLYVPALVQGILGSRQWMAQIGRSGGKSTSPAKTAAARSNGAKGGRPRKKESVGNAPTQD